MTRASLLTTGLEGLADKSSAVASMLKELYALDDELQDAHRAAKEDDEYGERVVVAYEAFLQHRAKLLALLEKERVAVPWQLRMRIDDIELTLRQRKEKQDAAAVAVKKPSETKARASSTAKSSEHDTKPTPSTAKQPDEKEEEDPLLMLKAMILPSALIAVIAGVVYGAASFAA